MVTLNKADGATSRLAGKTLDQFERFGQVPAHHVIGQVFKSNRSDLETAELLKLLGTLVTTLKTWMNNDNAPHTPPAPVAVIPKLLV
ncbi:hypothetical protein IFR08_04800 [Pseudomonas fluorescens]|uniref:hypothetical protein n=1 Tax=Pseudomonas fluorescens TaxID=294 RepID=UPI001783B183|nr:hypothetical protein [Pseudomonas fluorescens]MBD8097117.1 hypothetical protein [Pseudomonas fluorescens]MBD8773093.1 hypothetical protein [Pseudomonas fluorescens]MBD8777423.1 hypothetical protein [Pseudomonas fluorescens]MBD8794025.1 hypothetical protein [Pseudomonas fluorescens]